MLCKHINDGHKMSQSIANMGIKLTVLITAFQIILNFYLSPTWGTGYPKYILHPFIKLNLEADPEKSLKTLDILCVGFLGTDTAICNSLQNIQTYCNLGTLH